MERVRRPSVKEMVWDVWVAGIFKIVPSVPPNFTVAPERDTENKLESALIVIVLLPGKFISSALAPLARVIWLDDSVP